MSRFRTILGLVTGLLLMLSAAAHSLMGWPVQRAALGTVHAPPDLVSGLGMGWHFSGAAMLAFGIIVTHTFFGRLRGEPRPRFAAQVAAVMWTLFGLGAYAVSPMGFFLAVFVVPGIMLAVASFGGD